jgi:CRISPR-associated protein Cmr6
LGLAYDAWAPVGQGGKVPENNRPACLSKLAGLAISPDYARAFERWKMSLGAPGDRAFEPVLAGRLLVGHGNASAAGVGMTVHHTWGVPVIPGSAVKGLLAHFVDAVYGPDAPDVPPWEQPESERDRARYQGVTWHGRRIERGPGEVYRALFGAPDAEKDAAMREHGLEAGASAGLVAFHDALYVPRSAPDDKPFAADVLTVHQKEYYNSVGQSWPNDYDSPNPVAFLTVRPGTGMLVALSGPPDWTELAERLLRDALEKWGIGGKTSAGYGRLVSPERSAGSVGGKGSPRVASAQATPKPGDRVEAVLLEERTRKGGWKARHDPSGLAGPIQNTSDVPADEKPGNRMPFIVASVSSREIAFRFPTGMDAARSEKKGKK